MRAEHQKRDLAGVFKDSMAHTFRPESKHEAQKLLERSFFMYLMLFPVNMVANLLLFRKGPLDLKNPEFRSQFKSEVGRATKSAAWTSIMYPIVGQYIMTFVKEFVQAGQNLDKNDAMAASDILGGAVLAAARHDDKLAQSFEHAVKGSLSGFLEVDENKARKLAAIANSKDATPQDLRELADFYDHSSKQLASEARNMALPFSKDPNIHPGEAIGRALHRIVNSDRIETPADAALWLSFCRTLLTTNADYVGVLRFFDPQYQIIQPKQLGVLGRKINEAAASMNLVMPGKKYGLDNGQSWVAPQRGDILPGELALANADGGNMQYLPAEKLMDLAQTTLAITRQEMKGEILNKAVEGYYLENAVGAARSYQDKVIKSMLDTVGSPRGRAT